MSMSTSVIGFAPPDKKWKKMKAVYDACLAADISIPDEVEDFFDGTEPDPAGVSVVLDGLLEKWATDSQEGYQIEIAKLPKNVRILRFYNSW